MRHISSSDFPFTIMDVASLLRLQIRRRGGARVIYADCPLCGDRRGKFALYPALNTYRCWHCGERGGMLPLYGKVHGISNSEAYREICDALAYGGFPPSPALPPSSKGTAPVDDVPADKAPAEEIHRTLTALLSLLTLTPEHREHLRTVRGLTDADIEGSAFKSTPPFQDCRRLTERLLNQGCRVQGVPGFYVNDNGKWTVKFYMRTSGILIPLRGVNGLLQGLQIRLDRPIRDANDPPDKQGIKYLPLTSTGKNRGVSSGCPIHFVGNPHARVVYVTEGALKADIVHALTGRTFAATMGASNPNGLDELFSFLRRNGTEEIIEAEDMDKYRNAEVNRGAAMVYQLARKNGMACRRLRWDPNYKGIDDWQLAIRRKKKEHKETQKMTFKEQYLSGLCTLDYMETCVQQWHALPEDGISLRDYLGLTEQEMDACPQADITTDFAHLLDSQRHCQHYRFYQLALSGGKTAPFAFAGIGKMREKGYEQPPVGLYRLACDSAIFCPNEQSERDVLARIYARYSGDLPEAFTGRNAAPSDVIELYGDDGRACFYCDADGFHRVDFSPAPARRPDADT